MKDFNEILSHLDAINKIDERKNSGDWDRRKAVQHLTAQVADELVAGRRVPVIAASQITLIDGALPCLADDLVVMHEAAVEDRTLLAERLDDDGGKNGAKAAAILRRMNAVWNEDGISELDNDDFCEKFLSDPAPEPDAEDDEPVYDMVSQDEIQMGDIVEWHDGNEVSQYLVEDLIQVVPSWCGEEGTRAVMLHPLNEPFRWLQVMKWHLPLANDPFILRPRAKEAKGGGSCQDFTGHQPRGQSADELEAWAKDTAAKIDFGFGEEENERRRAEFVEMWAKAKSPAIAEMERHRQRVADGEPLSKILREIGFEADDKAAEPVGKKIRSAHAAQIRALKRKNKEKVREAEQRGFQKARLAVLRDISIRQANSSSKEQFRPLMGVKAFVFTMQMEG